MQISAIWNCTRNNTEVKINIDASNRNLSGGHSLPTYHINPLSIIIPIQNNTYELENSTYTEHLDFKTENSRLSWKNLSLSNSPNEINMMELVANLKIKSELGIIGPLQSRELACQFLINNTLVSGLQVEILPDENMETSSAFNNPNNNSCASHASSNNNHNNSQMSQISQNSIEIDSGDHLTRHKSNDSSNFSTGSTSGNPILPPNDNLHYLPKIYDFRKSSISGRYFVFPTSEILI